MRLTWALYACSFLATVLPVSGQDSTAATADTSTTLSRVELSPTIKWQHNKAGDGPVAPTPYSNAYSVLGTATNIPAATAIARQNVSLSYTIPLQAENEGEILNIVGLCWYPVSGFYGRLSRILFYTTMLFALVARRHQWLIIGALAASMTYAGTAAIHACILVWSNSSVGNNDMYAALGILVFSSAMIIPLLTWSKTIKDIGKSHEEDSIGRSIAIAWSFLIFIGFMTIWVGMIVGRYSINAGQGDFHVVSPYFTAAENFRCTPPNNELDLTAGQNWNWTSMYITKEFIDQNVCTNPCERIKDGPTILKPAETLIPLTNREIEFWKESETDFRKEKRTDLVILALFFGGIALIFSMLQGLTVMLFGRRSPTQVRNKTYLIFRSLFMNHDGTERDRDNKYHKVPHFFAKTIAYMLYAWGVVSAIISGLILIGSIIATEFLMAALPQSDEDFEVDQWSAWVATGLVLITAFLYRFEGIFEDCMMRILNRILDGIHSCFHGRSGAKCISERAKIAQLQKSGQSYDSGQVNVDTQEKSKVEEDKASNVSILEHTFFESLHHYRDRFMTIPNTMSGSWKDSKAFYKDTLNTAEDDHGNTHNRRRKVVNLDGQKFPTQWKEDGLDDWLTIEDFVRECRKYDDIYKSKMSYGYKWQPRVIPDDKITDSLRTEFNRALLKDIVLGHKKKHQRLDMEGAFPVSNSGYTPVSGGVKAFSPKPEDGPKRDSVIISALPIGQSNDYDTSIQPQEQSPKTTQDRKGSFQTPHVIELNDDEIHPIYRSSTTPMVPVSQYSALRRSQIAAAKESDPSPKAPAHLRHAATFQERPKRRPVAQRSSSAALAPYAGKEVVPQPTPARQSTNELHLTAPVQLDRHLSSMSPTVRQSQLPQRPASSMDKTLPQLPAEASESWVNLGEEDSFLEQSADYGGTRKPVAKPVIRTASNRSWMANDDH